MKDFESRFIKLVREALIEDVGDGDHSTLSCIPASLKGKAILKIKQEGILAGLSVAEKIFRIKNPDIRFLSFKADGDFIKPNETAFEVAASVHTILQCERLVLNCMQRMSGIATLTHKYTELLKGFKTRLLDTRKTTPNFRLLEKEAVRIGGGFNHRFGLFDLIMLKDNHIDFCGGIEKAVNSAYDYISHYRPDLKIEVEARRLDDVETLLQIGIGKVFRVMLDNFDPPQVKKAVQMIKGQFETEASGGITLENIKEFAETGVDFISSGAVIHQAQSIDLSLKAFIT